MSETLPLIRGNPRQIEDLWVNLLLLSRDATVDGAAHTIRVRTWAEAQDCIAVEIYDDGKPIPPDELDTIFEPNFVESKIGRGSGMELSICREIVRQHQGKISAESVPGHGTIFQVRFPVEVQV
jgi:signal transduction histidine kinase